MFGAVFTTHFILSIPNFDTLCTYTISNLILKISLIAPPVLEIVRILHQEVEQKQHLW